MRDGIPNCPILESRPAPLISERTAGDAGVSSFRVADNACVVNLFSGNAYVGSGRQVFRTGTAVLPAGGNLAAILRRVVFVRPKVTQENLRFLRLGSRIDTALLHVLEYREVRCILICDLPVLRQPRRDRLDGPVHHRGEEPVLIE